MTKVVIKLLVFDEHNLEHIKKHKVSKEEVEKVGQNFIYHRRAHTERYLAIGRASQRIITLVIKRVSRGQYYLVTARDASKKERRDLYDKEKK